MNTSDSTDKARANAIKSRQVKKEESARHENHFVVGFSDGLVTQYSGTGKAVWMNTEVDNEIFAIDVS